MENVCYIPIVFIHEGNQKYLSYAVRSAEKFNKSVFLIGDNSNKNICKNHIKSSSLIDDKYLKFEKAYIHMSSNVKKFEILCFKRYFLLLNFMKEKRFKSVMMLDSDVLSFCNYSELGFQNYVCALSMPKYQDEYRWSYSPHCSYWTENSLTDFIEFCLFTYSNNGDILKQKYEWQVKNRLPGGICDMTLLYLWGKDKQNFLNTAIIFNESVIDHNIQSSENYEKNEYRFRKVLRIKEIRRIKKEYKLYNNEKKKYVKLYAIHCQGSAKELMEGYFEGKNIFVIRIKSIIIKILNNFKKKGKVLWKKCHSLLL